jgi:murein DD-endopeptidase MepM/ murein hydrolase activator NlpD
MSSVKSLVRFLFFAIVLSISVVAARPFIERAWLVYTLAIEEPAAVLHSPLAARRAPRLVDSWGNARSGGRRHEGIDIFAPKDTPVLSTTRGIVTRVGTNRLGGRVVWILGPGMERHYYAHLNRYAALRAGDPIEAGDIIGYTGNTGNARGGPAHLHYGIYRYGAAQNPYPRLARNRPIPAPWRHPTPARSNRRLRAGTSRM